MGRTSAANPVSAFLLTFPLKVLLEWSFPVPVFPFRSEGGAVMKVTSWAVSAGRGPTWPYTPNL